MIGGFFTLNEIAIDIMNNQDEVESEHDLIVEKNFP